MIDSHIHLSHIPTLDAALDAARALGVNGWLGVANDPQSWADLIALRRANCNIALGLHPLCVDAQWRQRLMDLEALVASESPAAIGECGLDGGDTAPAMARQEAALAAQAAIAHARGLAMSLHSYRAVDRCCKILREQGRPRGVLHGFIGSVQQATRALDQGLLIGIGGAVTYPRAARLRKVVQALPADGWVLETDAPYQPVHGAQGQPNPASALVEIAKCVAALRGARVAEISAQSTGNAQALFGEF